MIAHIDEAGAERVFEGRCEGELIIDNPRGERRVRLRPGVRSRRDRRRRRADDGRARARREARDQPPRPRRAGARRRRSASGRETAVIRTKAGAAGLSVASNSLLIALKLAAGRDHRLDRDHHRGDPLGDRPARLGRRPVRSARPTSRPTREHPYGHEKVENLAAAIEGMLILVGAGIIIFEATRRLVDRRRGRRPRHRHRGDRVLGGRQLRRLGLPLPAREGARIAGAGGRRGAPAHRRAHLARRARRPAPGRDHRRGRLRLDRGAGASRRRSSSPGSAS